MGLARGWTGIVYRLHDRLQCLHAGGIFESHGTVRQCGWNGTIDRIQLCYVGSLWSCALGRTVFDLVVGRIWHGCVRCSAALTCESIQKQARLKKIGNNGCSWVCGRLYDYSVFGRTEGSNQVKNVDPFTGLMLPATLHSFYH